MKIGIDIRKWHHRHYITSDDTCSRCRRKIADDEIPLRFWPKSDRNYMLIYCDACIGHVMIPADKDEKMQRNIICPTCATVSRKRFPTNNPYPGEYLKFIGGTALNKYLCDHCGDAINIGDKCTAFSIWTDTRPYLPWESDYIKIPLKGGVTND